jgi:branched-chain amino acid transport system substrate-binding protein
MENKERFVNAIKKASETIEDARGSIKLDDYGNPTGNVCILKVERAGGRLVNTVIHTYPMVWQFWTYGAADFLKLPLYTRDYPPVQP